MKEVINQNNGINQVGLVKSNNNQITIINSPTEHMSWLIRNGKLEEASELLAKVYQEAEKMHPLYPNYIYKPVEFGSNIAFEHRPANKEIAKQLPLRYKGKFSIKDRDVSQGESFSELLTRKYFSQEKISIDMKYIETWIGDQLIDSPFTIEQHAVKEAEWFIVPERLPTPVKAKLVISDDKFERFNIDYLELRIIEKSKKEDKIIISNIHQVNSPVILSLTIPGVFSNESSMIVSSKFNIKIRESFEGKVIAEKIFLEFMKYANQCSKMSFVELEHQREFFKAEGIQLDTPLDAESTNERIRILSELLKLENTLNVEFHLPDQMDDEDFSMIEILKAIVEDRVIVTEIENFDAVFDNKDAVQKLVNDIKDRPIMLTANEDKVIELFGVKFENITVAYTFENLVVKNPERIKRKLVYLDDGETVKVEFKPGTKNIVKARYKMKV